MDKRLERQLEEVLKLPGNEQCADCRSAAPRWASVNLGIFICVGCASVHRKLGTHKSRVKSCTLDTWNREQIAHMRSIGNTAANRVWNPDERMHPPPTSSIADERDGEMERFIRKKYEQGGFKAGAPGSGVASTSLSRAKERDGRLPAGSVTGPNGGGSRPVGATMNRAGSYGAANARNPELNDVLVAQAGDANGRGREKELPHLPNSAGLSVATRGISPSIHPPRQRPSPSSGNTPQPVGGAHGAGPSLIDIGESSSSSGTRPLQVQGGGASGADGVYGQMQNGQYGIQNMAAGRGMGQMHQMGHSQSQQLGQIGMGGTIGNPWAGQSSPMTIQTQQSFGIQTQGQAFGAGASPSSYQNQQQLGYQSSPNQQWPTQPGSSFNQQTQQSYLSPQPNGFPQVSPTGSYSHAQFLPIPGQMPGQNMGNGTMGMSPGMSPGMSGMGAYGSSPNGSMMQQGQIAFGQMNGGQSPTGYVGMGGMQYGQQQQGWQGQAAGTVYGQNMR